MSLFTDILTKINPTVAGVDRLAGVSVAGLATLTDGRMWRSLGWLLLGLVLILLGGWLLIRGDVQTATAPIAAAALA